MPMRGASLFLVIRFRRSPECSCICCSHGTAQLQQHLPAQYAQPDPASLHARRLASSGHDELPRYLQIAVKLASITTCLETVDTRNGVSLCSMRSSHRTTL